MNEKRTVADAGGGFKRGMRVKGDVNDSWQTIVYVADDGWGTTETRSGFGPTHGKSMLLDPTSVWEGQVRRGIINGSLAHVQYLTADFGRVGFCEGEPDVYRNIVYTTPLRFFAKEYPDVVWPELETDTLQIACAQVASKLITDSAGELWSAARLGDWLYEQLTAAGVKDPEAKP